MSNNGDKGVTATEKNVAALNARVLILEAANAQLILERDEAVGLLKQANDLIEADTKAQLVKDASEVSDMPLPELAGKDINELETIIAVSKLTKSVAFDSGGNVAKARTPEFDSRTHLHSIYEKARSA